MSRFRQASAARVLPSILNALRKLLPTEGTKQNEHLDAYIGVSGIEVLFDELQANGANIVRPLEERPWNCKDFYVEDADGHILCFSEGTT